MDFFTQLIEEITLIRKALESMAISQSQFDADLQAMIAQMGTENQNLQALIAAIQAFLALPPVIDLTAEDTQVNAAAQAMATAAAAAAAETAQIPQTGSAKPTAAATKKT